MKSIIYIICMVMALVAMNVAAETKNKSRKKAKTSTPVVSPYAFTIGYPSTEAAFKAINVRTDVANKPNARPFGWQQRNGAWVVLNEKPNLEWAFTSPGHYAHPSVIKRMIDVGSTNHVYVDMAFRCGAENKHDCKKLLTEFKEVNLLIRKVYQKKYIVSAEGTPAWVGVDSLE